MTKHAHNFVETYDGFVGFGLNRKTDEQTVMYYLQKFSDDIVLQKIIKNMTDDELSEIFDRISLLLKKYLSDDDYHKFFLKEE